ncbi:MAG: MCE family protein [Halobacteriovoraceae bacterium]|nr:MCE family protein [Halobacteriovoraceae bacterium]
MKNRNKIVTFFISISIAIVIGTISLILIKNKTFKPREKFYTMLDTARGLSGYPPIYFKGYTIGKVTDYNLTHDLQIKVNFYIYKEYLDLLFEKTVIEKNANILSNQITDFRLVLPKKEFRKPRKRVDNFIMERSSPEAKAIVLAGEIEGRRDGISGIVDKVNLILDRFDQNETPAKLTDLVTKITDLTEESQRTVASYNSLSNPDAKKKFEKAVSEISTSISAIDDNLTFLRGILKVLYQNKSEITPILMKTNRTLDNAQDALEGINNNPLIRGGIRRKEQGIKLETLD